MKRNITLLCAILLSACTIVPVDQPPMSPSSSATSVPGASQRTESTESVTSTGAEVRVGERLLPSGILEIGNADAPVSLLIFTNHSCAYCRDFERTLMPSVISQYIRKDLVRVGIVPYVLQKYPASEQSALTLLCATEQGKGIAVHELLFRDDISPVQVRTELVSMGLDSARHQACMQSDGMKGTIAAQQSMAQSLGVTLVPTYFINGKKYVGFPEWADLRGQLQEAVEGE